MPFARRGPLLLSGYLLTLSIIVNEISLGQTSSSDRSDLGIRGTVFLEAEDRPAPGVQVIVRQIPDGTTVRVLTDDRGAFTAQGLSSSFYEVFAEEPGFESSSVKTRPEVAPTAVRLYLKVQPRRHLDAAGNVTSVQNLKIPPKAMTAYDKGMHRLANNDAAGSVSYLEKAVAISPDFYEAYYSLGVAQRELHLNDQAIEAFQRAIAKSEGNCLLAEFALGVLLSQNQKPAEAETVLRKALEHDPGYAKGYFYLSAVLFDLNRLDEAERAARQAQHRKPDLAAVYLVLANIHARRGNAQEELRDLAEYLRLNPPDLRPDARQVYEELRTKAAQE